MSLCEVCKTENCKHRGECNLGDACINYDPAPSVPPRCPGCGNLLIRVNETVFEPYDWDPEKKQYFNSDPWGGSVEMECCECGFDIIDVFPDGICNYEPEEGAEDGSKETEPQEENSGQKGS